MSDQTPPADQTPPVEAAEPARGKWYKVLCWPTADKAGKPVVYTRAHDTAGAAVNDARERINRKHGDNQAEGWTFTVQRTTKPKDAPEDGSPRSPAE